MAIRNYIFFNPAEEVKIVVPVIKQQISVVTTIIHMVQLVRLKMHGNVF